MFPQDDGVRASARLRVSGRYTGHPTCHR